MNAFLQRAFTFVLLLALIVALFPGAAQAVISFIPPITNRYDLGSTAKLFRSTFLSNLTVANTALCNSTLNITGTTTLNALVGNSTVNATGLVTANNVVANSTVNTTGLLTTNGVVCNTTLNTTGVLTADNVVSNGTVNATSNATVGGELAVTGNGTVSGTLYGRDPLGATLSSANLTLTSANVGIVWVSGMGGNRTCTIGTAASVGAGGWYEFRSLGNVSVNGNVTVNVTSGGNINGADTYPLESGPYQVARIVSDGSVYSAASSIAHP